MHPTHRLGGDCLPDADGVTIRFGDVCDVQNGSNPAGGEEKSELKQVRLTLCH